MAVFKRIYLHRVRKWHHGLKRFVDGKPQEIMTGAPASTQRPFRAIVPVIAYAVLSSNSLQSDCHSFSSTMASVTDFGDAPVVQRANHRDSLVLSDG